MEKHLPINTLCQKHISISLQLSCQHFSPADRKQMNDFFCVFHCLPGQEAFQFCTHKPDRIMEANIMDSRGILKNEVLNVVAHHL